MYLVSSFSKFQWHIVIRLYGKSLGIKLHRTHFKLLIFLAKLQWEIKVSISQFRKKDDQVRAQKKSVWITSFFFLRKIGEGVGYLGHKYQFIVYCPHFPHVKRSWEEKL